MNSPSSALVWELWRKNRWSFILAGFLLLICTGLKVRVDQMEARAAKLRADFEALTQGSFSLESLLSQAEHGSGVVKGSIEIGTVGYSGPLVPGDRLSWSGDLLDGLSPVLNVRLNDFELANSQPLPPRILITVPNVGKRTLSFVANQASAEMAASAKAAARWWRSISLGWSLVAVGFSILLLFAAFGWTEPHPVRGFTGMAARRFTLPVSTWILVAWPVFLGAFAVVVLCAAWWQLALKGLTPENTTVPIAYLTALLAAGLAIFQLLVWGLASFPKARAVTITGFMLGLLIFVLLPFADHGAASAWWRSVERPMASVFAGVWACTVPATWLGVRWERQGRWAGCALFGRVFSQLNHLAAPAPNFRSALHAQLWVEWRRNGRNPLLVWIVLVLVLLGLSLVPGPDPGSSARNTVFALGVNLAIVWLVITGLNLGRDGASRKLALSSFTAVRPISGGDLLLAKFIMGAALWFGALLTAAACYFLYASAFDVFVDSPDWAFFFAAALAALHLFVGIFPFCLWGRTPGFPWSLLPLLFCYGVVANVVAWFSEHPQHRDFVLPLLMMLVLVKLVTAFWAFRRAVARRIIGLDFALGYSALWYGLAGMLLYLAWWTADSERWLLYLIIISLVPLARVALAPLALESNRHR